MRLREMMCVQRRAVTDYFTENIRAAFLRMFKCFERQNCRAFTERQSVTMRVKRAAPSWRQGLQGIEPREHKLTERVIAAGDGAFASHPAATVPTHDQWRLRLTRKRWL